MDSTWVLQLSDGSVIVQDYLPNLPSAWQRAIEKVNSSEIYVTGMKLYINNIHIKCMDNADYYLHRNYIEYALMDDEWKNKEKVGCGSVIGNTCMINWINTFNNEIEQEIRIIENPEKDDSLVKGKVSGLVL